MLELQPNGDLAITIPAETANHLSAAFGRYCLALENYVAVSNEAGGEGRHLAGPLRHKAQTQRELARQLNDIAHHVTTAPVSSAFLAAAVRHEDGAIESYHRANALQSDQAHDGGAA